MHGSSQIQLLQICCKGQGGCLNPWPSCCSFSTPSCRSWLLPSHGVVPWYAKGKGLTKARQVTQYSDVLQETKKKHWHCESKPE